MPPLLGVLPYGIDTAEVTMMLRELLHLVGVNTNWILEPAANCNRTGNHLGLQPHTLKENTEYLIDDIESITGVRIEPHGTARGGNPLYHPVGRFLRRFRASLP